MATNLTRFEIVLPSVDSGTTADAAIQTFINNIRSLTQLVMYTAYIIPQNAGTIVQQNIVYGLLTSAQQVTALGYLNTLNSSLGQNVLCTVSTVTQEP